MELLSALGVNSTIWIHLGLFFIAFLFLSVFVFKPYSAALEAREKRTGGADREAAELIAEVTRINQAYEAKAKTLNASIRAEYEKFRSEAAQVANEKNIEARQQAAAILAQSRQAIQSELAVARSSLAKELPSIKAEIVSRMTGKEISA